MSNIKLKNNILSAVRGEFSPSQFSARLFMNMNDMENTSDFLVWFHERFHYLQSIFTPYGHLKWGAYRSVTADIVEAWIQLPKKYRCGRKVPIAEYLKSNDKNEVKISSTIWMHDTIYQIYNIIEQGQSFRNGKQIFFHLDWENICPEINLLGKTYRLKGLDILESFAKFEEAMLSELLTGMTLDESINPERLNKEYYSALYYFIDNVGLERLIEFPVACELALATPHIPSPLSMDNFCENAPNWRFVRIVNVLKT